MSGQQDGYALGVDLGTSNTVAVLRWPDGRTRPLLVDGHPILPSGVYVDPDGRTRPLLVDGHPILPSGVYVDPDGHLHVGRDAQRLAQADPAGYEPNPKRRVDEETVELGGRAYRPAELLAATLRAVADAAVAAVGFLPPSVVTHPAAWAAPRRQVLHDALALAGWPPAAEHTLAGPITPGTRLLREPVAAARYYTQLLRRPVPVGGSVAVFDFGGGTLDVAVLRNEGADPWGDSGFALVASGGVADLGGLDLDAALVGRLGDLVGPVHPAAWARLTGPRSTAERRDLQQLWDNVRGAKEMLSRAMVAPVAVPGVEAAARLTREDLELLAAPLLARAVAETRDVIAAAGLVPGQLAGLFLVGGSSRVPLVARMLHADLGVAPTVLEQPELPVAEGALTDLPLPRRAAASAPAVPAGPHGTPPGSAPPVPAGPAPGGPHGTRPESASAAPTVPVPAGAHDTVPQSAPPAAGPHGTLPAGAASGDTLPAATVPVPASHATLVADARTLPGYAGTPTPSGHVGAGQPPAVPDQGGFAPGGPGRPDVPFGAPPVSPAPGSGAARPGRGRRNLWIALGAGLVVVGVVAATVLWALRDPYPALKFHDLEVIDRYGAGSERPSDMFTSVLADRAYLAYPRDDDRLQVVAVDTATGGEKWRKSTPVAADRWAAVQALPGAVAVLADAAGASTPRELVVLDAGTGKQRWQLSIHGDDALYFTEDTAVWLDRTGGRLVGLRLDNGEQKWDQANPRNEYGDARTAVVPVGTGEALGGPAYLDGSPRAPWLGGANRLVQVGADRSVRVVDMDSGEILRSRGNVANVDDLVAARDDQLYVTEDSHGYRLLAYNLGKLGGPAVLYTAPDERRRAKALVTCGEHRACLLEVPDSGAGGTEVVAVTEGKATRHWSAPEADGLVPLDEHLVAWRDSPQAAFTLFDPEGTAVLRDRDGVAGRIDGGNLLLFAETPSSAADDRSVAGMSVSDAPDEMGLLKDVRSESCSWNAEVLACGAEKDFVLYRFAG
ncbi:Hsp70 family protein [Micromonospora sp. DR5-3]|uniref:Hsp70 family protein n=1 Tax=unclassified Micromonospora TaxID=2617518 RepID=UPI0011D52EE5|nr:MULTISPECIES: Hsp70 family protein [unclassified Micromonospora]MCW3815702.1 Hsp70 family protein [Micromonospora sp. DR5-3]TYC23857.1 Hsp70 family protein [Micromonospora sp. MP36]